MCTCGLAYNYYVKVTLIEGQVLSAVSLNFTLLAFVSSKEGLKSKIQWNYLRRVLHVLLHSFSGVDFQMKMLIVDGEQTVLQLWDTAGQERQVLPRALNSAGVCMDKPCRTFGIFCAHDNRVLI